jgi:hypothetical protein
MNQEHSIIRAALNTSLPLELSYVEHDCECMRGISPELAAFVGNLLSPHTDDLEPKLLATHSL